MKDIYYVWVDDRHGYEEFYYNGELVLSTEIGDLCPGDIERFLKKIGFNIISQDISEDEVEDYEEHRYKYLDSTFRENLIKQHQQLQKEGDEWADEQKALLREIFDSAPVR